MWSEFSWENKILVNTNLTSLADLINRIAAVTHMKIITDISKQAGSDFMAANLFVGKPTRCDGRHALSSVKASY